MPAKKQPAQLDLGIRSRWYNGSRRSQEPCPAGCGQKWIWRMDFHAAGRRHVGWTCDGCGEMRLKGQ